MNESPFLTINRVLSESSNAFDDLRIIASGSGRLDTPTRELIRGAADELESAQRMLIQVQAQLIETQRRLMAVNEQLIEARKVTSGGNPGHFRFVTMGTGWVVGERVA